MPKYKFLIQTPGPLIDVFSGTFRRGAHEGETIDAVAETREGRRYLNYLYDKAKISADDKQFVEDFLEQHPEYWEEF